MKRSCPLTTTCFRSSEVKLSLHSEVKLGRRGSSSPRSCSGENTGTAGAKEVGCRTGACCSSPQSRPRHPCHSRLFHGISELPTPPVGLTSRAFWAHNLPFADQQFQSRFVPSSPPSPSFGHVCASCFRPCPGLLSSLPCLGLVPCLGRAVFPFSTALSRFVL